MFVPLGILASRPEISVNTRGARLAVATAHEETKSAIYPPNVPVGTPIDNWIEVRAEQIERCCFCATLQPHLGH